MSKPRQDMPLADSSVPSLSPVDTPNELPTVEATPSSPLVAQRAPETVQRTTAATRAATPISAAHRPAAQPFSVAAARVQRAPVESGAVEADEPPLDRSTLPSITSQLRQMRPATMPKPKETPTGETLRASTPVTLQRAPEPESTAAATRPPIGPQPISRPAQTEAPVIRRKPRAQITEVTPNASEPAAMVTSSNTLDAAVDSAPRNDAPHTQVQRSVAPEAALATPEPVDTPAMLDRATPTPTLSSISSAVVSPPATPTAATSPSAISPRQLARLFTSAKTAVQRQTDEAASQPRAPLPSAEDRRVRRFVETVQREAQAFTGQTDVEQPATSSEAQAAGSKEQVAISTTPAARVQRPTNSDEVADTVPAAAHAEAMIQRAPDLESATIEAEASQTAQVVPSVQRAIEQPTFSEAPPPAIQRAVDQSSPVEANAAPAMIQRLVESSPDETVDRIETAPEVTTTTPTLQRAPERPAAPTMIQRASDHSDSVSEVESIGSFVTASEPIEIMHPSITPTARPQVARQVDSTRDVPLTAVPFDAPAVVGKVEAAAPTANERPAITPAPPTVTRAPDMTPAEVPPTVMTPPAISAVEAAPVQVSAAPSSNVQRDIEPTPEPVKSITAQLRRRIAEQASQSVEAASDTRESGDKAATPADNAGPLQPALSSTREARIQRLPDLPLIRRAQTDRSGGEDQSAAATRRTAASSTSTDEHIQRAIEPAVSSAPANQVQRVLGEAGESGAAIDLNKLARDVYPYVKRLIAIERERRG